MKVLVADDNVAIQEILREIIISTGNEVVLASGVKETADAILEHNPDLIFLDMYLEGEPGLKAINMVHEEDVSHPMRVYVVKNSKEYVPKDNAFIIGEVEKPFKINDILKIIDKVRNIPKVADLPRPAKPTIWEKRRTKKEQSAAIEPTGLSSGKSYLFVGNNPDSAYASTAEFIDAGYDIMVITGNKIKAVKEKTKSESVHIMALSPKPKLGYSDVKKLGTLTESVNRFIREKNHPVILFDSLSMLIERNGANRILTMLRQLTSDNVELATFIIFVEEGSLYKKEIEIMANNMKVQTQH